MIQSLEHFMTGLGTAWILYLMIALSVISVAVMLERAFVFFQLRDDVPALMSKLSVHLKDGKLDDAKKMLAASPSSEAAVVLAGLEEAHHGAESASEAMQGATAIQKLRLETRLAYLGTLGNNAPFIGLLGTVIGIVGAFAELKNSMGQAAQGAQMASGAVMANIAEALVATAIGLIVAIPAVAAFNTFQRMVKVTLANTDALGHVLLAHLKAAPKADGKAV